MMLKDAFTDDLYEHIIGLNEYIPYPPCNDRNAWDRIPDKYKESYIKRAEEFLDYDFKPVTASLCLHTGRTDDLTEFDKGRGEKHSVLYNLVMAECFEDSGRFIKQIFNGIWSILDDAVWYRPWRTPMGRIYPSIMVDVTDSFIELAVSSTAYVLAISYYLLKDKLDDLSPMLFKRLYAEMDRRIFRPYLDRTDIWWMAYYRHYHKKMGVLYSINNFTPHCTNYVMEAFLLLEKDGTKRSVAIRKTLDILDNYLNFMKDDGWCDEGAGYWGMAYGGLNLVLDKISKATGGYVNVFDNEKIKAMGQYLVNAHIGNGYFVNFSDCHPVNRQLGQKKIEYALNTNNEGLLKLAFEVAKDTDIDEIYQNLNGFERTLFMLFNIENINQRYGVDVDKIDYLETEHYYEESQVLIVREDCESYNGLYLACKGGHNDENHNHNDAGNFIVFKDSMPVLVDPGVEKYIADTFNTNRYKMWTMQSKYHNLPTFNGVMQKETRKYRAKDVKFIKDSEVPGMSMNLKDAYERESGLIEYDRMVSFDRMASEVICSDSILMKDTGSNIDYSFITPCSTENQDGLIKFYSADGYLAELQYDKGIFEFAVEEIDFRCERLKAEWGGQLRRISLKTKEVCKNLDIKFRIR